MGTTINDINEQLDNIKTSFVDALIHDFYNGNVGWDCTKNNMSGGKLPILSYIEDVVPYLEITDVDDQTQNIKIDPNYIKNVEMIQLFNTKL